ncbi:MAG TPA: hypothetical protein VFR85_10930 [Anaeromyxobacteraceae bacterium]|nr:hypothetical protein [Anaeromyxobacteraceae bacterium]
MPQAQGAAGRRLRARVRWLCSSAVLVFLGGCTREAASTPAPADVGDQCTALEQGRQEGQCGDPIPMFDSGQEVGYVCPADARRLGLAVVDLSDDWVPFAFRDPGDSQQVRQPYRATYVALANEEFPPGAEGDRARRDAFLELYGIFPSIRVLSARLLDEERHACHGAIDLGPIRTVAGSPQPSTATPTPSLRAALEALERRLACEGLLPASSRRAPRWRLQEALEAYQRKHMIVSRGRLDGETRRALARDSRELDFRALLRSLRARVIDATGLIEDGTALGARGTILTRQVDGDDFYPDGDEGLEGGAPDLVSPATEAAAQALGWTDPLAAAEFFRRRGPDATRRLSVALRLPPAPPYHAQHMHLRVEIDRGEVWYELPRWRPGTPQRPALTLYAETPGGEEIALLRWPTTIGGWKREVGPSGRVGLRYKNSEVGKRVWRDLVVSPAWLPPPRTPARALVRRGQGPRAWLPDTDLLGPGYASAYGLVMLVHHRPVEGRNGTVFHQNGIRTHGSVNYHSITNGDSHGCHRLFNHAAVQLASFLLQHRRHVRHGLQDRPFTHEFTWRGIKVRHPIPHRGYRFELTPPVEVEVLPGTVRGRVHRVPLKLVSWPRPRSQPTQPETVPAAAPAAAPAAGAAAQWKPPENPEWGHEGG